MPVFNEANTVADIISRVEAVNVPKEIVIVDDGSTDGTRDILAKLLPPASGAVRRLIFQDKNQGKGACIRVGIEQAAGDYIVIQDADLEYDPQDYPLLLAPLLENRADVVYGSRYLDASRHNSPLWHQMVNAFLTQLSNLFTGLKLTDMETCYKMFRAPLLKSIPLRSNRFGFEPEVTAKIAKRKARVVEVPISYHGRTQRQGKKINWTDGVAAVQIIARYWLVDDSKK